MMSVEMTVTFCSFTRSITFVIQYYLQTVIEEEILNYLQLLLGMLEAIPYVKIIEWWGGGAGIDNFLTFLGGRYTFTEHQYTYMS